MALTMAQLNELPVFEKIKGYKDFVEGKIIGVFWKKPELLLEYSDIRLDDFIFNKWRVYYQIIYDICVVEGRAVVDDTVAGVYLEKHLKLKDKYEQYNGYDTIEFLSNEFTKVENIQSDINESNKWNTIIKMIQEGFPVTEDKLKDFVDMPLDYIYDEYELMLNHIFIKANQNVESYSISDGIDELVGELDEGMMIGLEYYKMPFFTELTNGCNMGNITILVAPSGAGKSSFLRNTHMTSCLINNEKIVIMINEEGKKKWQREFICWVANNIYSEDLQKHTITNGKYTKETRELILKCVDWIKEKGKSNIITLIPLKSYSTDIALKCMRKYISMGVKYFAIDTFKADIDVAGDDWGSLEKNMVKINDLVKPENKNVHIFITMQARLSDIRARYLSLDNIAKSKSVTEVASTVILIRKLFDDEYPEEKNALNVYTSDGKIKQLVSLDKNKRYYIAFVAKNRDGESGYRQIVFENDLSRNMAKEVGYTSVPFV